MKALSNTPRVTAELDGMGQDIRELLADLDQCDEQRRDKVFNDAREAAKKLDRPAYLMPLASGWMWSMEEPSKYHEGTVIMVPPSGACVTLMYDGDRGG